MEQEQQTDGTGIALVILTIAFIIALSIGFDGIL